MIVNTMCSITHTTIADQSAWYSVPFTYVTLLNIPQITVTLDGVDLTYGSNYILGVAGIQLTVTPPAGKSLIITRTTPMTQAIDFQTGFVDPDEIEHALDLAAMRDQELAHKIQNFSGSAKRVVTIPANGWANSMITVSIPEVTPDNAVIYSPAPESIAAYSMYGVLCLSQQNGSLTFSCSELPEEDIVLNMVFMG